MTSLDVNEVCFFLENILPSQKLNNTIINKLSSINILNKSAYYWINICNNIFNDYNWQEKILNELETNHNNDTLQEIIIFVTKNISKYLKLCDKTMLKQIDNPLQKNKKKYLSYIMNLQNLETSNENISLETPYIKIVKKLPILKNTNAVRLSKILNLCSSNIWYPIDTEELPLFRAVLYNLLVLYNIEPIIIENPPTSITTEYLQTLTEKETAGLMIQTLSKLDKRVLESFNNLSIITSTTEIGRFLNTLLDMLNMMTKEELIAYEKNILHDLEIEISHTPMMKDERNDQLLPINIKEMPKTKLCQSIITNQILFKILSEYPNLKSNTNIINFNICPILIKYIFSIFPYYNKKEINIINNNIVLSNISNIDNIQLQYNNIQTFEHIKSMVNFDNNYMKYKTIITQAFFTNKELDDIISFLINSNGFACMAIAAQILEYHKNININANQMYILLSKLTSEQLNYLDEQSSCKLLSFKNKSINNSITTLFKTDFPLRELDSSNIQTIIYKMLNKTFAEKINIARMTNFHELLLIQHLELYNKGKEFEECIKILLLYSNTSIYNKTLIYQTLYQNINIYDLTTRNISSNPILEIMTENNNPCVVYRDFLEKYNLINLLPDLIDYIKNTKNNELIDNIYNNYIKYET
uniref:Uncharacterized protein n=1 Tax=Faxonius propinquus nudivirus TaxID=3139431 RepID=A0AAU8GD59_9VIRU